jgi:oligopeptide/dipeptide ABC transporter ATP-binding protein
MRLAETDLLQVSDLTVDFEFARTRLRAVDHLSYTLAAGECLGIVGESGSGKSISALALLNLIPTPGRITGGRIWFDGHDLLALGHEQLRSVRGAKVAMVFQDPNASLNPLFTIGRQLSDVVRTHWRCSAKEAKARALEVLSEVGFSDPARRFGAYPFELSGGLRQRVSIAMALSCRPRLVIADEPTTNLDVSIQAQIIDLLSDLKEKFGFAIIFISHDLGVVASIADRVMIMYGGQQLELGPVEEVLNRPLNPYTTALLASAPTLDTRRSERLPSIPGAPPHLSELPQGCPFSPRCPVALSKCQVVRPRWIEVASERWSACHVVEATIADHEAPAQIEKAR